MWRKVASLGIAGGVIVAGGIALAPAANAADTGTTTPATVTRLGGTDRNATAEMIAHQGWPGGVKNVYLAYASNFPDALAAVPLAAANGSPILLMDSADMPLETFNEIVAWSPPKATVLGGTGVIPEQTVKNLLPGQSVTRLGGSDRYATAVQIGQALEDLDHSTTAVLATGNSFGDALSIAPVAAVNHWPIVFTQVDLLPASTSQFLKTNNIKNVIIVGGTGVVSSAVQSQLSPLGVTSVTRIAGADRYATSAAIAQKYASQLSSGLSVATGANFADALTGGVLSAKEGMPLLLLNPATGAQQDTDGITSNNVYVYGGTGALPDAAVQTVVAGGQPMVTAGAATITGPGLPADGQDFVLALGSILTVNPGAWVPYSTAVSWQWLRDGVPIKGETSATYTLTTADVDQPISVRITGTADGHATTTIETASVDLV